MQSLTFPRYLVPPRSKYSPQHHILKHPQLPFLPQCQRPSFTPIQSNRKNYILKVKNIINFFHRFGDRLSLLGIIGDLLWLLWVLSIRSSWMVVHYSRYILCGIWTFLIREMWIDTDWHLRKFERSSSRNLFYTEMAVGMRSGAYVSSRFVLGIII